MFKNWKKFILDESGQTTTEYILILVVVVTMIMNFKKQFKSIIDNMFGRLDSEINDNIFNDGG